ncbi:MAG: nucleotidyltransferase domain-containing protein [Methanocellales archaeon]|nr:nucleotidyltransferase domain-containing protein [Methanocellales archaeon]
MIPSQVFGFLKIAVNEFETLKQVIMFGSFARNEYDARSDIDMLLLFEERDPETKHLSEIIRIGNEVVDELSEKGEQTWEFQFAITGDIQKIDPSMRQAIINEGIVLYGKHYPLDLERKILYSYALSGKTRSEMVRFNRALKLAGLMEKKAKNVILVNETESEELKKILERFGVKYNRELIFEPSKSHKIR